MTRARAPFMEWARHRPRPEVDLASSNLLACTLEDLPGAHGALDIAGESPDGYAPLVEAIAQRYGVAPERVATAGGCSGAVVTQYNSPIFKQVTAAFNSRQIQIGARFRF